MSVKIGLALGSGAARGWSHIGVIRALEEHGIKASVVSGCSIGAIVGAAYASSNLDKFEEWIRSLTGLELAKYAGLVMGTGFVNTTRLNDSFMQHLCDEGQMFEDLDIPFAAVGTDLITGREVWFTKGDVLKAIFASIAIPGMFPSIRHKNSWVVDGGLVNPVPVNLCRSLGADVVIAVGLNSDTVGKRSRKPDKEVVAKLEEQETAAEGVSAKSSALQHHSDDLFDTLKGTFKEYSSSIFPSRPATEAPPKPPSFFDTIASSVNIMQDRIARSRMAGDPPDVLISPRLSHIGLMEFHRADETIKAGYDLTIKQMDLIRYAIGE
ncbi:patatin [Leucothrix sargassi]|nr:patatin [Leucothrix sargassi]